MPDPHTGPSEERATARRDSELRGHVQEYLAGRSQVKTGFDLVEPAQAARARILSLLGATPEDWASWEWQLDHRFADAGLLARAVELAPGEASAIGWVQERFRWAVSPYYASLLDPLDPLCPLRRQAIPSAPELEETGELDPLAEGDTSPAPGVVRRYPDRLTINVTNQCAMLCRHCQRRRNAGRADHHTPLDTLEAALAYVRRHDEIRDVLLTGGDALLVPDAELDWLLAELDRIPHVEIKRIGTRCPVTLPQRLTPQLARILGSHPPLYLITQFNHPREVTPESALACARLAEAGVVLGNQSVLLRGVNDNPHVIKRLCQELLRIRVRPYYLFQALPVRGTLHFRTRIQEGMAIMEQLRGYTSGLAIPTYAVNAPRGGGKVPLMPGYVVGFEGDHVLARTWEGRIVKIPN